MKTIPICKGLPGLVHTSSNQVSPRNKTQATYTDLGLLSFVKNIFKGLNFAYKSPKSKPRIGTPIHKNTHKTKGVIETVADSLFIKPGTVSKLSINKPNNLPLGDCLVGKRVSFEVRIDSFHEAFKNTKVRTIVRTAALSTMLKGIGKSPTFIIP